MKIREITPQDARDFIQLLNQVDLESEYMLLEPGERNTSLEEQRQRLKRIEQDSRSTIFVVEDKEKRLLGYLAAFAGNARRTRHSVYLTIGMIKNCRGQGVGTQLFQEMEKWAEERGIVRLELTVVCENQAAVGLYRKMGFEIEGTKRASLLINGALHDEYLMSKLLCQLETQ
ncbi:GCN5-like N-acetyltransferase [Bacillus freudenreichii]|nr:GCN5-like N-acetyltransferase [Bacillus freudenreichii]